MHDSRNTGYPARQPAPGGGPPSPRTISSSTAPRYSRAVRTRSSTACRSPSASAITLPCARPRDLGRSGFILGTDTAPYTRKAKQAERCATAASSPAPRPLKSACRCSTRKMRWKTFESFALLNGAFSMDRTERKHDHLAQAHFGNRCRAGGGRGSRSLPEWRVSALADRGGAVLSQRGGGCRAAARTDAVHVSCGQPFILSVCACFSSTT